MASGSGLRSGGRAQNSSAPYVGNNPSSTSLLSRPSVVNQTLGFQSNATIPYHWTIARWANDLDKNIMNGQIVFLKQNENTPLLRNRAYTMLNLPMINYALYREALQRQKGSVVSGQPVEPADVLADILKTYRPMGSVINDVNGKPDTSNNADRVINVCISGRQTTFNIWGNIHDGDFVYLKLEMKEIKGSNFNLSLSHHSTTADDQQTIMCYQWIPFHITGTCRWKAPLPNKHSKFPVHYFELGRIFRCARGKDYKLDEQDKLHYCQHLPDMASKTVLIEIHWNIKG